MRALSVALVLAVAGSACASFEDPSIVLDLRVLAMRTSVLSGTCIDGTRPFDESRTCYADQVIDVDPTAPDANVLIQQLQDVEVRALVSDPGRNRQLEWTYTLCLPDDDGRCDRTMPHTELGSGVIDDPEGTFGVQEPHLNIVMDPVSGHGETVLALLNEAIKKNPIDALGGVDLFVELRIGGVGEPRENQIVAVKRLKIAARIPITRTPNRNPRINRLDGAMGPVPFTCPGCNDGINTRCADLGPLSQTMSPGEAVTLFPVEREGEREDYDAPALDGSAVPLTETISYQWLATGGSWSDETTGGGHDLLGNQSLLGSDWRAPATPGQYSIWMIQRDERFGVSWLETCIEVR